MSEVTAVPIRPLARGTLLKLWAGLAILCLGGAGLAWIGTRDQQVIDLPSGAHYRMLSEGTGPVNGASTGHAGPCGVTAASFR